MLLSSLTLSCEILLERVAIYGCSGTYSGIEEGCFLFLQLLVALTTGIAIATLGSSVAAPLRLPRGGEILVCLIIYIIVIHYRLYP